MGKVSKQHKRLVDLDHIVNFDVLKADEEVEEEKKTVEQTGAEQNTQLLKALESRYSL